MISITRVFRDVVRVFLVYLIVWGAHAMCAWSLFKPFQEAHKENRNTSYTLVVDDFKTVRGFLTQGLWRMLYADDHDAVHVKAFGADDENFSLEFSHAVGIIVWMSYQIIMSVLMINILIAIMNTTYSEVWLKAESEWKFERTRYLVSLTFAKIQVCLPPQAEFIAPRTSFTSPFSLIYYLAKAAYVCKRKNTEGREKNRLAKVKYFKLLNDLIQRRNV